MYTITDIDHSCHVFECYSDVRIYGDDDAGEGTEEEGDVQKKIMPWRQMLLDEEVVTEVEHGVKQEPGGGLVVVTSLINKIPNLGGKGTKFKKIIILVWTCNY